MTLQEALRLMRLELGMTQADLAHKLNKGVVTVNRWENGKLFPSRSNAESILQVAKKSGASKDCLCYLSDVLLPECKRPRAAVEYGYPDIDRDFLFQLSDESSNAVYVVEADTYNLLYLNRKAERYACRDLNEAGLDIDDRQLSKQDDKRCYHFFGNRPVPCKFCPLPNVDSKAFQSANICIPESGRKYIVRAKKTKLHQKEVYIIYLTETTEIEQERLSLYRLTDHIPLAVGIYHVYQNFSIERAYINTKFSEIFGIRQYQKTMLGKMRDISTVREADREKLNEEFECAASENRNIDVNVHMKTADGSYRVFNLSSKMIKKDNEKFTVFLVISDA